MTLTSPRTHTEKAAFRAARRSSFTRRLAIAVALGVCISILAAAFFVWNVLPYAIIRPARWERQFLYRNVTPASFGLRAETFCTETEPGVFLHGWLIRPERDTGASRRTLVLFHGSSSCKEALLSAAQRLVAEGYGCLLYDSRACGESSGTFCTYGYRERRDFSRVLDDVERRFGPLGAVGVWGSSLGGAIALGATADDPRVRCAVVESTFADLRVTVADYVAHATGIRSQALADFALRRASQLADFPAFAVRPVDDAARIERPVLVIHGAADDRIDLTNGERIFRALQARSPASQWLAIPRAGHFDLSKAGGAAYRARLLEFLNANLL